MLVNPSSLLQVFHRLKVFVSYPNSHGSSVSMNCRWQGLDTKIEVYILFVYIQLLRVAINMQMNFADGMDWTRRGIHFVCVYSVVDELLLICR